MSELEDSWQMDSRVRALETKAAVQEARFDALTKAVDANTAAQEHLSEVLAGVKGGKAVIFGVAVFIAFLVDIAFRLFGGKG